MILIVALVLALLAGSWWVLAALGAGEALGLIYVVVTLVVVAADAYWRHRH